MSTPNSPSPNLQSGFPSGLHHAYQFAAFNALSYQMILGGPMILYAKSLGASATLVGVVAGMMPLLVIFQIPAASHIHRTGYRRFVLAGWTTRVLFIFGMALLPLTKTFLDARNRLALLLALLFCFNLSRGISSSAWLPWITTLVPGPVRGHYLARDAGVQSVASFVAFLIAALALTGETNSWQFAVVFGFSATMGAISLTFLKRIPDVPVPNEPRQSTTRVPWLAMANHPPFRKLLMAVVSISIAYGGITAFCVSFLKTYLDLSETKVLFITSTAFLGGVGSLWLMGSRLDRLGSRPVLGVVCSGWCVILFLWVTIAGKVIQPNLWLMLCLQYCMGLLAALSNMACNRLAMAVIPVMGRNHFFALYSVISNVTLGLAPIGWGLLIDAIGNHNPVWLGVDWNRFAVFFAAALLAYLVAGFVVRRLDEPEAVSMEAMLREILIQSPQRFWLRFWPRS